MGEPTGLVPQGAGGDSDTDRKSHKQRFLLIVFCLAESQFMKYNLNNYDAKNDSSEAK